MCKDEGCCPKTIRGQKGDKGNPGIPGTNGAPGFQSFSFSIGQDQPYVVGGNAAGKIIAKILWPGTTNYPKAIVKRVRANVWGAGGGASPDFNIELIDSNGNVLLAHANNVTNAAASDIENLTLDTVFPSLPTVIGVKITDNNLSNDKVNLSGVTIEF